MAEIELFEKVRWTDRRAAARVGSMVAARRACDAGSVTDEP